MFLLLINTILPSVLILSLRFLLLFFPSLLMAKKVASTFSHCALLCHYTFFFLWTIHSLKEKNTFYLASLFAGDCRASKHLLHSPPTPISRLQFYQQLFHAKLGKRLKWEMRKTACNFSKQPAPPYDQRPISNKHSTQDIPG